MGLPPTDDPPPAGRPRIVVVGLGPAGEDLLTSVTATAITEHPVRFLRTTRHPAATAVVGATAFDEVYEQADSMEEVYRTIADRLVEAAHEHGTVLYAVPGSPVVGERSVELLTERARDTGELVVDLVPALSFVDLAWLRLGVDPVAVGARVIDGHRFDVESAGSTGALLVAQCDHPGVLEAIKLVVGDALDRAAVARPGDGAAADSAGQDLPPLVVCARLGTPEEEVRAVAWHDLDRVEADHLTSVWIPPLGVALSGSVARLDALVTRLRSDCPWDRAQDHASLRPHLLEETHEVLEALDALAAVSASLQRAGVVAPLGDEAAEPLDSELDEVLDDAYVALEEELGDLLFQVVFHSCLATEAGRFTLADVADGIADKLVARHPHVFGDVEAATPEDVRANWEQIKKAEKGRVSVLDGIPSGLPALALAAKVLRKATSVPGGAEVLEAVTADAAGGGALPGERTVDEQAVGERLLAAVAEASAAGVDAEAALRAAVARRTSALRAAEASASDD